MIKQLGNFFIVVFLGLQSLPASPDILVLVHGYLGNAASWERSGVSAVLHQNGWQRAGIATPAGMISTADIPAGNKLYTVELPSIAPIRVQADVLHTYLYGIQNTHPDEPLVLVGHSAGGVVARLLLIRHGLSNTKALVTIASPHLGTARAIEALDATDDPFPISMMKDFFAGEIYDVVRDSWGVLLDLTPAHPGSLLHWLNQQSHPDIQYISVLRPGPVGLGDELVPSFSQDMNNVQALAGKSVTHRLPLRHALQPADGIKLVEILQTL
ncbi:MAG: alpha/beta fold hydrolase [Gammaproteobacteria bacterium]|nr:alpha/beta fold hydrolase [Gammaproteobacteria bacterium]